MAACEYLIRKNSLELYSFTNVHTVCNNGSVTLDESDSITFLVAKIALSCQLPHCPLFRGEVRVNCDSGPLNGFNRAFQEADLLEALMCVDPMRKPSTLNSQVPQRFLPQQP